MTNLQNNIDHYMKRKSIKNHNQLLSNIAHELGYTGQDAYNFAKRERSNFSKMLKETRPLKHEFIIPLEKIFGVSLAQMTNEDAYKMPFTAEDVPFVKGIRYYAYKDDPELYKNEFVHLLTTDGKTVLEREDEFGKTFIDYIVEYSAVNGVKLLHDTYHIKLKHYTNNFDIEPKGSVWVKHDNAMEFARLVANMNDTELFNDIYDTYCMFAYRGGYLDNTIYSQPDFFEIILDHKNLFDSIFEIKKYSYELSNKTKQKLNKEAICFASINPIINGCLKHSLEHLNKYREQAVTILKFGIQHNQRIKQKINSEISKWGYYPQNELGGIFDENNEISDVAIISEKQNSQDTEINALLQQLPKFTMA